ncbi:hypothetical protein V8C42DRAFT_324156 [Trichoderma barbatum]
MPTHLRQRSESTSKGSSTALQSFIALTKDAGSRIQLKIMAACRRKRLILTVSDWACSRYGTDGRLYCAHLRSTHTSNSQAD